MPKIDAERQLQATCSGLIDIYMYICLASYRQTIKINFLAMAAE